MTRPWQRHPHGTERRRRGGIIMAELDAVHLQRFLDVCEREHRTTGYYGGQIISAWLDGREMKPTRASRRTRSDIANTTL